MKRDNQVFDLIEQEKQRQLHGIELIASENFVSDEVMQAMGSVLTNKYAEGYPGARYYGGCQVVDKVEQLAIDRVCELYGAEYANVQPHSGAQANMAVFMAVLKPGDTFMGLDLAHGGHLSHGSPVNMSGILYKAVGYQVGQANYSASKAGMIGLAKSVALELGARGVRANAIAPGFIITDMTAKLPEAVKEEWNKKIPLRRGGTPEEIAKVALFLGSDLSSYVSGQVIEVNGAMNS